MTEPYSYVNTVHFLKTVSSKVIFNMVIFLFYPNYGHQEYTDIQNILKERETNLCLAFNLLYQVYGDLSSSEFKTST